MQLAIFSALKGVSGVAKEQVQSKENNTEEGGGMGDCGLDQSRGLPVGSGISRIVPMRGTRGSPQVWLGEG